MPAIFAIRRGGTTRRFVGRYMDEVALAVFARGPGHAETIVTDLPRASAADTAAAAGFLIDHDARRAVVFDHGVCFDVEEARVNGWALGTSVREAALRSLDLYPEEEVLLEVMRRGDTPEAWIEALQRASVQGSWRGWALAWGDASAVLEQARPVPETSLAPATAAALIEAIARAIRVAPDRARALDFTMRLTIEGPDGGSWLIDCREQLGVRTSAGETPPLSITLTATDAATASAGPRELMKLHFAGRTRPQGDPMLLVKLGALLAAGQG